MPDTFQSAVEKRITTPTQVMGYEIRKPFSGEDEYFKKNPDTAGMATEDGKITLNPYSKNSAEGQMQVAKNEAIRLWLKQNKVQPDFEVTKEQLEAFKGTEYGKPENVDYLRHSLIARALTNDKSAGAITPDQQKWIDYVSRKIENPTAPEKAR